MKRAGTVMLTLLRAPRRSASPLASISAGISSSSSLRLPTLDLFHSFPFSSSVSFFSSSSSASSSSFRLLKTAGTNSEEDTFKYEATDDVEIIEEWEEEEEAEPQIGDGADGGGVVFQGVPWGERALFIAYEVLQQFGQEIKVFSFRTSPRGYVYIRLDKLSNEYGCPAIEELEGFSQKYKTRLDEAGAAREIPEDLALEVSSPGAERLLRVPDDLPRFKEMPMRVTYVEETSLKNAEKSAVFLLVSIDSESEHCIWKLADVRENRDPQSKGRPLSRKQKDLRFKLPFTSHKKITLYLD